MFLLASNLQTDFCYLLKLENGDFVSVPSLTSTSKDPVMRNEQKHLSDKTASTTAATTSTTTQADRRCKLDIRRGNNNCGTLVRPLLERAAAGSSRWPCEVPSAAQVSISPTWFYGDCLKNRQFRSENTLFICVKRSSFKFSRLNLFFCNWLQERADAYFKNRFDTDGLPVHQTEAQRRLVAIYFTHQEQVRFGLTLNPILRTTGRGQFPVQIFLLKYFPWTLFPSFKIVLALILIWL